MRGLFLILGLATVLFALEPREIYDRAAPATVALRLAPDRIASGVVLDVEKGFVVTFASSVLGRETVELQLKDGSRVEARVASTDAGLGLALLVAGALPKARALPLAPALTDADAVRAQRVYGIGHPSDPADELSMWKFNRGIVSTLDASPTGLAILRHDLKSPAGNHGGPLLDGEARLLGLARGDHALPVNAIRAFLAKTAAKALGGNPEGALDVRTRPADRPAEEPKRRQREPIEEIETPPGIPYGPYQHLLTSREKMKLKIRAGALFRSLRGLHFVCPRCKGKGTIRELVQPGYWLNETTYIDPVYEVKTCPRCNGKKKLFRESVAEAAFRKNFQAASTDEMAESAARREWLRRLELSGRRYTGKTRFEVDVSGPFGTVRGSSSNPIFPLRFRLLPSGRSYEWFLFDAAAHGRFEPGAARLPGSARIAGVPAGDVLLLQGGQIVRVCGVVVPDARGKVPKTALTRPDASLRDYARERLLGATVALAGDKYADLTCDGHAIAFVEVDGKDYGIELLRLGLVRKHPKHRHQRYGAYRSAETEAKKAKRGIWE